MVNVGDSPCDWISLIQRGLTAKTGANNTVIKLMLRSCPARRWLTSTMPWLMLPYCLLLSITRLMTMMVAMATAMTSRPMRALLLRLKSSRSGPTDSCSNRTDRPQGVRDGKPTGAPGPCCPSSHPGGGAPIPSLQGQTQVSRFAGWFFTIWATREAQEYWSGWPKPSPADLPDLGIKLGSPALQATSLPTELSGKTFLSLHGDASLSYLKVKENGWRGTLIT